MDVAVKEGGASQADLCCPERDEEAGGRTGGGSPNVRSATGASLETSCVGQKGHPSAPSPSGDSVPFAAREEFRLFPSPFSPTAPGRPPLSPFGSNRARRSTPRPKYTRYYGLLSPTHPRSSLRLTCALDRTYRHHRDRLLADLDPGQARRYRIVRLLDKAYPAPRCPSQ